MSYTQGMDKKFLYSFRLPVRPVAWARPAPCKWGMYDTQAKTKKEYLWEFNRIYKGFYLTQAPLIVSCSYEYAIPKSWSKHKQREALAGCVPYLACDLDNTLKFTFDLFSGTLWEDDRQIIGLSEVFQNYALSDGITLKVWQWIPTPLPHEELQIDMFKSNAQDSVKTVLAI